MNTIEVVGLGALNIDHLYAVERILDAGEATAAKIKPSPGGSAATTNMAGLAKQCGRLGYITTQFCITQMGARKGLPTIEQLSQRYQEFYSEQLQATFQSFCLPVMVC